ncbi:MAG: flippase, partial [Solobacterium sp.]|nr:flippase [Solobacterium sp.]
MKKRSLRVNAMLYAARTVMSFLFPFITYPYVARVLGVENIGKVTTSANIVSYFILIAQMGVLTYATREGARLRDDSDKLNSFASQVFSINLISMTAAYILLILTVAVIPHYHAYSLLILIQSFNIVGTTIGVEWMCAIFEDYAYIAVRSFAVQIATVIMLFTMVKQPGDYAVYAAISVIANTGANVMNFFHVRKYVRIRLTRQLQLDVHLRPLLIIFFSAVATTIYVNSDVTMLSFMCGDYNVGLYNASVRIYSILQSMIASIFLVALPRLSNDLVTTIAEQYKKTLNELMDELMLFLLPVITGVYLIANEAIRLFSGQAFMESVPSLRILSLTLLFSMQASFLTNTILLPNKMESLVLRATTFSAAANVVLNIWFIPRLAQNGAALTTLAAEILMACVQYWFIRNRKLLAPDWKNLLQIIAGCVVIIACCTGIDHLGLAVYQSVLLKVVLSAAA